MVSRILDKYYFTLQDGKLIRYHFSWSGRLKSKMTEDNPNFWKGIKKALFDIPLSLLNFRVLEFPFFQREKIRSVLPFELESFLVDEVDNYLFDFVVLDDKVEDNYQVLVAYLPKREVEKIVDFFSSQKVILKRITASTLRLFKSSSDLENIFQPSFSYDYEKLLARELKSPQTDFSFKKKELSSSDWRERGKNIFNKFAYSLSFLLFLLSLYLYFKSQKLNQAFKREKEGFKLVYQKLFPQEKRIISPYYQLQAHLKQLKEEGELLKNIEVLSFLKDVSSSFPVKEGKITIMEGKVGEVILKGVLASTKALNRFEKNLTGKYDYQIQESKLMADGKIHFTMRINR